MGFVLVWGKATDTTVGVVVFFPQNWQIYAGVLGVLFF